MRLSRAWAGLLLATLAAIAPREGSADEVAVRYPEGLVHGFLNLRALDGAILADGELIQFARSDRVTSRLILRFPDGSLSDETAVFSQSRNFRLVSDRLVQKGAVFPHPMEVSIDTGSGRVTVRYTDDGKPKEVSERMALPPDLANGIVLTLLKNLDPRTPLTTVSMVAATPKPRLVRLAITPAGEDSVVVGTAPRKATHFVAHIEIGGLAGVVAPLLGKQPADTHVWILEGEAPAFIGSEGPLALEAPSWRLELASPAMPRLPTPADGRR